MLVDEALALNQLQRLAQVDICPALSPTEVSDLLTAHKRASLWVAATITQLGSRVIPTLANRNGHRFIAVAYVNGGQSTNTTEPSWPTDRDAQITDGNVIWQEDGWDWDAVLWDLRAMVHEAWMIKAGKAASGIDVQDAAGLSLKGSQLFDHCTAQAKQFSSNYVV